MKLRIHDPRILAIDLRHRHFGFAVYEGHRTLIDWGMRVYPAVGSEEAALAHKRLTALLVLHAPSQIIFKAERWESAKTSPHMHILVKVAIEAAREYSAEIRLLNEAKVKDSFRPMECETRDEIAEALARIFPEVALQVPPKKRVWQAEHPRMMVFDAIALGFAYWHHPTTQWPVTSQECEQDSS